MSVTEDVSEIIDIPVKQDVQSKAQIDISVLSAHVSDGRVHIYGLRDGENDGVNDIVKYPKKNMPGKEAVAANLNVWTYPLNDAREAPVVLEKRSEPSLLNSDYIALNVSEERGLKIYFDHNSTLIRPNNLKDLHKIVQHMKNNPGSLSVEGHASRHMTTIDATQRVMGNLKISMKRAYNVAQELVRLGVPAESIRLVGWGETRLPANGADGEQARRVKVLPF